jgi:hypothetical protein
MVVNVSFTYRKIFLGGGGGGRYPSDRRLAVLEAVVKRELPSPRRESNPRTPIVQPVAQRYID